MLNQDYHLYIFYKKNTNFCLKLKVVHKAIAEL